MTDNDGALSENLPRQARRCVNLNDLGDQIQLPTTGTRIEKDK